MGVWSRPFAILDETQLETRTVPFPNFMGTLVSLPSVDSQRGEGRSLINFMP